MRHLPAALLLCASACVAARPYPPPPRVLPAPEAVAIATHYARAHGLLIDYTQSAHLDRYTRWHVNIGGAGGRDRAAVTLDGFSGRVLAARLWGPQGEVAPTVPPSPGGAPAPRETEPQAGTPPSAAPEAPPPPPPLAPPPPPMG